MTWKQEASFSMGSPPFPWVPLPFGNSPPSIHSRATVWPPAPRTPPPPPPPPFAVGPLTVVALEIAVDDRARQGVEVGHRARDLAPQLLNLAEREQLPAPPQRRDPIVQRPVAAVVENEAEVGAFRRVPAQPVDAQDVVAARLRQRLRLDSELVVELRVEELQGDL